MKKSIIYLAFVFLATSVGAQVKKNETPQEPKSTTPEVVTKRVKPTATMVLEPMLHEISGLATWNDVLWGFNDDTDTSLYAMNPQTGAISHTYELPKVRNQDWEELTQDTHYFYLGDFGNNSKGNRENLHILRIEKQSLLQELPKIDTLWFSYSNQETFIAQPPNQTDFDCEAMIVKKDSIYLFTKQWTSEQTSVYVLPKVPGTYKAQLKTTFNVEGLITGATYCEEKDIIALCGYSSLLNPFVFLLYAYQPDNFFSGKKLKIDVGLPFHQVEGITTSDGLHYTISNEAFVKKPFFNVPQQLHTLDLSSFFGNKSKH
ncbi:T9SS C-terminal target domain-containing protein [Flavobacterium aciduliphilum]|uniref:T9SS C-terminal target domain-containing protein n=1 Tax=Flavobacterium aciduliphilum TaxID=1101402 RepID=A0A328YFW7_9FLAO|nr:T9SS C-terminal target domain-containing protein [Flavobacterium aciduliphilum]RAR70862.1 hypothetical protein CLV55_109116 [Flavobacterium aciduliphilum]